MWELTVIDRQHLQAPTTPEERIATIAVSEYLSQSNLQATHQLNQVYHQHYGQEGIQNERLNSCGDHQSMSNAEPTFHSISKVLVLSEDCLTSPSTQIMSSKKRQLILIFRKDQDRQYFELITKRSCIQKNSIRETLQFVRNLGKGSQAIVDLYKLTNTLAKQDHEISDNLIYEQQKETHSKLVEDDHNYILHRFPQNVQEENSHQQRKDLEEKQQNHCAAMNLPLPRSMKQSMNLALQDEAPHQNQPEAYFAVKTFHLFPVQYPSTMTTNNGTAFPQVTTANENQVNVINNNDEAARHQQKLARYIQTMKCIQREIDFLRELSHCDNVITLDSVFKSTEVGCFRDNFQDNSEKSSTQSTVEKIQLVLKFAPHGSLLKYIMDNANRMSEDSVRTIMTQLLLTVHLMQRQGIYHRDLKPDNILLLDKDKLIVCIADLGLACRSTDTKQELTFRCGTPGYVAPELLKGFPYNNKSDVFSLGCLFFNLVASKMLFSGPDTPAILQANKFRHPEDRILEVCKNVSQECRDLMVKMCQPTHQKRLGVEECLNHPWFKKNREQLQNLLQVNKNLHHGVIGNISHCSQQMYSGLSQYPNVIHNGGAQLPASSFFYAPNLYQGVDLHSIVNQGATAGFSSPFRGGANGQNLLPWGGGQNSSGYNIKQYNFLGTGVSPKNGLANNHVNTTTTNFPNQHQTTKSFRSKSNSPFNGQMTSLLLRRNQNFHLNQNNLQGHSGAININSGVPNGLQYSYFNKDGKNGGEKDQSAVLSQRHGDHNLFTDHSDQIQFKATPENTGEQTLALNKNKSSKSQLQANQQPITLFDNLSQSFRSRFACEREKQRLAKNNPSPQDAPGIALIQSQAMGSLSIKKPSHIPALSNYNNLGINSGIHSGGLNIASNSLFKVTPDKQQYLQNLGLINPANGMIVENLPHLHDIASNDNSKFATERKFSGYSKGNQVGQSARLQSMGPGASPKGAFLLAALKTPAEQKELSDFANQIGILKRRKPNSLSASQVKMSQKGLQSGLNVGGGGMSGIIGQSQRVGGGGIDDMNEFPKDTPNDIVMKLKYRVSIEEASSSHTLYCVYI
ncbi:hypothetical protein FGO68_gene7204 [Halteria grandinella]|uniref:Protein kinase domain-containing protein n=1 Tax=Halteria grandinella TaxID=5974 RepID=A0A8J8SXX6_HALGN|nr:hypothetical protein FGO68_gene7204 [Halteria grandinella]